VFSKITERNCIRTGGGEMSSICKSFESNAWRNDLCSHCFQSKEEHDLLLSQPMTSSSPAARDVAAASSGLGSRYQSVLNHCRSSYRTGSGTAAAVNNSLTSSSVAVAAAASSTPAMTPATRLPSGVKAILKTNGNNPTTTTARAKQSKSVNFPDGDQDAHEEVIGYGGQECFEDDQDEADHRGSDDDDDDDVPFTDEERMVTFSTPFFPPPHRRVVGDGLKVVGLFLSPWNFLMSGQRVLR
jgi:hypothetical protein